MLISKINLKNTDVILVSKDFNIRIKARALGIPAQDYFNDKVMTDAELLHTGIYELPENFWEKHSKAMESWQEEGKMFYKITGPLCKSFFMSMRLSFMILISHSMRLLKL